MGRVRIRPSKAASTLGMIVGFVFMGIGLVVAIPVAGPFGIIWTVIAAAVTVVNAINVFSDRGLSTTEIDLEDVNLLRGTDVELPFDERLRRLEQLRREGLINDQEYQLKRDEVMRSRW